VLLASIHIARYDDCCHAIHLCTFVDQVHKHDHAGLQRRLAESHETCRLLRSRMEELVGFLQEMLLVTPPQKGATERRAHVSACLNETLSLLADLSVNLDGQGKCFSEAIDN